MNKEVVVIICPDVLKKPHFYDAIKERNYEIAVVADMKATKLIMF